MKVKELFTLQELAKITDGQLYAKHAHEQVNHIFIDSRSSVLPKSLFIAIKGQRFNGHDFIEELSENKEVFFLVDEKNVIADTHSFILVENTLNAFQAIAKAHREQYQYPVIGITGSAGKTIIKEWLFQLLSPDFYIVKSPKSYNSQVGVPLSVMQMNDKHELGIFEAGISISGEMPNLGAIIQPSIGILTNIGAAHDAGFADRTEKLKEKLKLFSSSDLIILEKEVSIEQLVHQTYPTKEIHSWSISEYEDLVPKHIDPYFTKNIGHCIALMTYLGIEEKEIRSRIHQLEQLPMRLEFMNGQWDSVLLNDSYSNDISGLGIVLDHARKTEPQKKVTLCLGQFQESGLTDVELVDKLKTIISGEKIEFLLLFGAFYKKNRPFFEKMAENVYFFNDTKSAIHSFNWRQLQNKLVVCKGSRSDQLEHIVDHLKEKNHDTIWEVNLSSLIENLNYFKSRLQKGVKLLVMVKATAYGTEANKIAQVLQNQRVDYLGVAYPEEGVALIQDGIELPILVMNTSRSQFERATAHHLEIQVFSIEHLTSFIDFALAHKLKHYPIHIKLETGMNRLGIESKDLPELISLLEKHKDQIRVKGILSHLAAADELSQKEYTLQQIKHFNSMVDQLLPYCAEQPILHLLNTSGILDDEIPQYDMVRLGIGLHGISMNEQINKEIKQVPDL